MPRDRHHRSTGARSIELKLLKCDWGMEHLGNARSRFRAYANAGYDGVEASFVDLDALEMKELLQELGLDHVAMVFARDENEFSEQLARVRKLKPILVNCHAGRDHHSFERGQSLLKTITEATTLSSLTRKSTTPMSVWCSPAGTITWAARWLGSEGA